MKKLLVLGLCCGTALVAFAATPAQIGHNTPSTAAKQLVRTPMPALPMAQVSPSAHATGAKAEQSAAMGQYMAYKEAGLPISAQLMDEAFGPQPVGSSRQGGDTAATATPVGALPYTDSGTTAGMAGNIGPFSNAGLTCPWAGYYSATSSGAGPDVFYSWTITATDTYTISLCGSSYDTALAIYQNLGGGVVGAQVAGNDDTCGLQSQIVCNALPVGNYFVVVDGWGTSSGAYTLNISGTGGVSPCDGAPEVVCGGSYTGDTTGDPNFAGNPAPDNVYIFESAQPQTLTLSLCGGSSWDTYLRLYDDCPNVGTQLASNDDFCGLQSELEYTVGVGTYYILVEGYSSNAGPYTLNVGCSTCAPINCTGTPEVEPNGGGGVYGTIDCGETVCGTTFTQGDTLRDTDWFELLLLDDAIVTVDLNVEQFNGLLLFVDSDATTVLYSADLNGFCEDETLTTECLPAGSYYVWVGHNGFSGVDTPANYGVTVSCETCTYIDPCDAFTAAVTTIPSLPYTGTGTNVGAPTVVGSDAGDVGYLFTLSQLSSVTFSACQPGTNYDVDSYLYTVDGPCGGGTQLLYNDGNSTCTYASWASEWVQDCILGPGTYMLVVSGYSTLEGNFAFNLSATPCACPDIVCTGTPEVEPNDGFNSTPNYFDSIACGETVCGTTFTVGDSLRDTDWFQIDLANDAILTVNLDVESFNGLLFVIDANNAIVASADAAGYCADEVLVTECLQAGTYYVWVGPNAFAGVDTPADYGLTVSCEACTWVDPYTTCQVTAGSADDWTAGTSEVDVQGANYLRAERFGGVAGGITAVDFRGLPLVLSGSWTACAEDPVPFTITFYDLAMTPVASYNATLTGVAGDVYAGLYPSMDYHFDLPAPLFLSTGHISIQAAGSNTCWFLWMSSATGADAASMLSTNGGAWTADTFDLNYCLTTVQPCDVPTGLDIAMSMGDANLSWNAAAGATSYNVFGATNGYGPYTLLGTSATTSFTDTGAQFAGRKFYQVTAICE